MFCAGECGPWTDPVLIKRELASRRRKGCLKVTVPEPTEYPAAESLGVTPERLAQGRGMMGEVLKRSRCSSGMCSAIRVFAFMNVRGETLSCKQLREALSVMTCQMRVAPPGPAQARRPGRRLCRDAFQCLETPEVGYVLSLVALAGVHCEAAWEELDVGSRFLDVALALGDWTLDRLGSGLATAMGPVAGNRTLTRVLFDVGCLRNVLEVYLQAALYVKVSSRPEMLSDAVAVLAVPDLVSMPRLAVLACGVLLAAVEENAEWQLPMTAARGVCASFQAHDFVPEAVYLTLSAINNLLRWSKPVCAFLADAAAISPCPGSEPDILQVATRVLPAFVALFGDVKFAAAGIAEGACHEDGDPVSVVATFLRLLKPLEVAPTEPPCEDADDADADADADVPEFVQVVKGLKQVHRFAEVLDWVQAVAPTVVEVLKQDDACNAALAFAALASLAHHNRIGSWAHLFPEVAAGIAKWVENRGCTHAAFGLLKECFRLERAGVPDLEPLLSKEIGDQCVAAWTVLKGGEVSPV